ncbi:MAG: flagellar biosynthesis protein FlhB [Clostridia bacterium]|nr:flagellar biosynthesis protein FlhB [Clostridia bacterium]
MSKSLNVENYKNIVDIDCEVPYERYNKNKRNIIDLQLFSADGKTEKATPKKKQDARKKGQVLQSREISTAVVLIFLFIGLRMFGGYMYTEIAVFTKKVLTEYPKVQDFFTFNMLSVLFVEVVTVILKTTAPLFAIAILSGVIASYAQIGFLFTMETLGVKFNRINPLSGLKRIFSAHSLVELVKSIIKITVVSFIAYSYLKGEATKVFDFMNMEVYDSAVYIGTTSLNVGLRICVALIILGILDYGYQWWEYEKNLKMTKQEVKEEYKQVEGNPEIKSKIKQKQREISMRRMLQDVPKADVVITNPTHFAVAIKYDSEKSSAPIVLAKGQDYLALRIKEVAKENSIEIVENKPLARTLYATVEIGQAIPPDLYQAVAEILAFVYSLKQKGRAG